MGRLLKDVSVRCALFLIAYYVTNSVFQSYISLYYADRGLADTQIGLINSFIALTSVFSMQLWGVAGDRAKNRNLLLCAMGICAAGCMLLIKASEGFLALSLSTCAFAAFYTSLQPMGDSIVLTALSREQRRFGPVRMAGGMSFAVMAMLYGRWLERVEGTSVVTYTVAGLCLAVSACSMLLPRAGVERRTAAKGGMLRLFKNKELRMLFLFMIPLQITLGYFYAFFSPLFRNDLAGGTEGLLGWCYFISAMSEIPFLLNSDKLFQKWGAGRLMCVSAATLALRWIIVALSHNAYVAMASQLLHSWGFIVITVAMSKYIQATVPDEQKASGQLLLSVFGFGVARVIGYFGGGVMSDIMGRQNVFFVSAGICAVCAIVFIPYYLKRKPQNGMQ